MKDKTYLKLLPDHFLKQSNFIHILLDNGGAVVVIVNVVILVYFSAKIHNTSITGVLSYDS